MIKIDDIKELAQIMDASSLNVIEIQDGETTIRMEKHLPPAPAMPGTAGVTQISAPNITAAAVPSAPAANQISDPNLIILKSPMVGVFYQSPSPDAPPFVQVGSAVKSGDIICIIEAMKLMNEITAEADGEIVEIYVHNGDLVEFGQSIVAFKKA